MTLEKSVNILFLFIFLVFRLYSSAVFNDQFTQFSMSEIQRKPIDDLVLQMKVMNINKVVNFPFPTAPDPLQLRVAETRLLTLGALEQSSLHKEGKTNYDFRLLSLLLSFLLTIITIF